MCALACHPIRVLPAPATAANTKTSLSREDALWLDRVTYGLDSATVARFRELGKKRFLEEQLSGRNDKLPAEIQAQIDGLDIQRTPVAQRVVEEIAEQKRINALGNEEMKKDARKERQDLGNKY